MGTRIRDKKEWSKQPAYRKAYEALAPEFEVASTVIEAPPLRCLPISTARDPVQRTRPGRGKAWRWSRSTAGLISKYTKLAR